jgi:hypothetical protein
MIQNIITNPHTLRLLRKYSLQRARETTGSARKVWREFAANDKRRMEKRA